MKSNRWLLPEGIEEILPQQARQLESLRRSVLDLFASWGYQLVMPPLIEHLDSLLTGTGHDLDLQTFKLTDQMSGRMLGIRADMTPQVARIDAHHLKRDVPTRLCYFGRVLQTRPDGLSGSRSLLQVGAELYGHAGLESDVEVLQLMVETLRCAGESQPYVDLGHVGIYRALISAAELSAEQENQLFDAMQRKAKPEISEMLSTWALDTKQTAMLAALVDLHGGEEVLLKARESLAAAGREVQQALDDLIQIATLLKQRLPDLVLHYDLAELRGYNYHTGVVFAAYLPGYGQALAKGGRYDGIGQVFGHARPATGFSTDLQALAAIAPPQAAPQRGILAPAGVDAGLLAVINKLRTSGERVVVRLPGQEGGASEMECDRQLVKTASGWEVKPT